MLETATMIRNSFPTHFYQLTVGVIFIISIENTQPLKILHFSVPEFAQLGARVSLSCLWQLDAGEQLYSMKWYKDGMEFFRYVPRDRAAYKKILIPGVHVLTFASSGSHITLGPAVVDTEGRYRCEVSGERPLFLTVTEYADITVLALPDDGPFLYGIGKHYKTGETVTGNCTSGPSRHNIHLAWYIDGVAAAGNMTSSLSRTRQDGLMYATLSLKLNLTDKYLSSSCIKIKCLSTIPSVYWKSNETCIILNSKRIDTRGRTMPSTANLISYSRGTSVLLDYDWSIFCISSLLIIAFIKL